MDMLTELQEKRSKLAAQIGELRDAHSTNGNAWKDDQEAQWEQVNADYDARCKEIETLKQATEIATRAAMVQEDEERANHTPNPKTNRMPGQDDPQRRAGEGGDPVTQETRALAFAGFCRAQLDEDLRDDHLEAMRACGMRSTSKRLSLTLPSTHKYRALQSAFRNTHSSRIDSLAESRAMTSYTFASGGALVPDTFLQSLELNMFAFGGVRQVAGTMVTGRGERMSWPTADDTSNKGKMVGESESIGDSVDPSFGATYWDAYKFTSTPVLVPYELLEDAFLDLPAVLGEMLGERLGRITAEKHTRGTGASEPKGIITTASLGVTTASETAITFDELIDLEHSIDPAYRNGAGYMFHDTVLLALRKLKDNEGRYLWQTGANTGAPDTINARPYAISMEMDAAITTGKKTVLFGQLSRHKIRRVRTLRFYRLEERYRDTDNDGFVAFLREDSNTLHAGTKPIKFLQQK